MRLGDIAYISSGFHFRKALKSFPAGTVPVIQGSDFDDQLNFNPDRVIRIDPGASLEHHRVKTGDVLIMARGHGNWAWTVSPEAEGMIPPGSFYVVRPNHQEVEPGYLAWWLSHPETQARLRTIQRGTKIPMLPVSELRSLPISLPPLEVQLRIVLANGLQSEERDLRRRRDALQDTLFDAITMRAAEAAARKD